MALKKEYELRGHQDHAVSTALKRDGNIIFSHPVGSGKTLTSIAAFEKLKGEGLAKRALVVTPASLRTNYGENGVKKFTDSNYVVYGNKQEISSDKTGVFQEPGEHHPEYGVVSYELFREDPQKYIKGHNADTVIFDEVHRIKNDTSKTFNSLKENRGLFRNFIGMTGSIVSNTPADVVPLIDAMTAGNHRLGSKAAFENRFVSVDKDGNKVVTNPILARALIAPYVHNVTDEQLEEGTGAKRPDKVIKEILVPLSGEHEELYRYVIDQLDPITKMKLKHGLGKIGKAEMDAIFAKLLKSRQAANSVHMVNSKISLEDAAEKSVKVKRLLDDVQSHFEKTPDAQVVIHSELLQGGIDVLEAGLKKRGIGYGKFIGKGNAGVTEVARQNDVNDYNSGKKRVLLISSAGGEGLDLPNTTMVASLDGHWNPEKINQVEARGIRLGGLSHRPEAERKVLVNRYLTKLPVSKLDAAFETKRLVDPAEILKRVMNNEPLFFNPLKSSPTVDQMMYMVAKQKAHGNDQLKNLFEKTSAFSLHSDKEILKDYLNKYQDKMLTGDYQNTWMDEADENKYIKRLRDHYELSKKNTTKKISVKQYEALYGKSPTLHLVKEVGKDALAGGLLMAVLASPSLASMTQDNPKMGPIGLALAGLGGAALSGYGSYKQNNTQNTTTTMAEARKRLKLTDEELRSILRGESVRTQEIKNTDHFIKMK